MFRTKAGLPWSSRGSDSTLPLQGVRVRSLVQEVPHAVQCGQKTEPRLMSASFPSVYTPVLSTWTAWLMVQTRSDAWRERERERGREADELGNQLFPPLWFWLKIAIHPFKVNSYVWHHNA